MLFGCAGSGKTCTMHVILDEDPPDEYTSTPLAVRPVKVYRVDMTPSQWKKLSRQKQDLVIAKACHLYDADELADIPEISSIFSHVAKVQQPSRSTFKFGRNRKKRVSSHSPAKPVFSHGASSELDLHNSKGEAAPAVPSLATCDDLMSHMEECSIDDAMTEIRRVQVSDCGGQPQYHEILPVFLRGTSLYLYVFKLNEELGARPMIKYHLDGKAICTPYECSETYEQILEHCLRVVRSQKATDEKSKPPRIMIIGTHKDKEHECKTETREMKNKRLAELLLPEFEEEVVYYRLKPSKELIYPLNAKYPGEEDKTSANQVRTLVSTECIAEAVEIPLQWHALEVLVEDLAAGFGRDVISKAECFVAAQKLHFEDESALDAALNYLDQLNLIFYYPDILPGVVFASAQVLLNKVTELVVAAHELRDSVLATAMPKTRDRKWQRFCDHALVSAEFLAQEEFQKHYEPGLFNHEDLMLLFKKLLIFADFSEIEVFVPALLQRLTKEELDSHRCSSTSSLMLTFPKYGGPLLGVFCATIVGLLSPDNIHPCPWKLDMHDDSITPICLYRNCVQFNIPSRPGSITLIDSFEQIEVHLSEAALKAGKEGYPNSIKHAVIASIRKATLALHYNYDKPEICFGCPCGVRSDFHLAKLGENSVWICSKNKEVFDILTPQQTAWLEEDIEDFNLSSLSSCTPEFHELDLFEQRGKKLKLIKRVAANWEDVATRLHFPGYTIKAISRDCQHQSDQACRSMFTRWLDGEGRKPITWGTLIDALNETDLSSVAQELDKMINSKSKSKHISEEPCRKKCQIQ